MNRQPFKQPPWWVAAILLSVFLTLALLSVWTLTAAADEIYQRRSPHRDGIGKIYMGREIAQVMGHTGATWLERPSRTWEEQPQKLIEALDLRPTDIVADLGAGTGYFSFRIAPIVSQGKVLAVDVQPEMIDILNFLKQEDHVENVEPILATPTDPQLPAGIDRVLMVDAYHEFEYPYEVMTAVVKALKPNGQVILAEYRGENPFIPIKGLHKMTQRQVQREMAAVGLRWVKTSEILPQQHLMVFEKPSPPYQHEIAPSLDEVKRRPEVPF
ncbi:MAG: methyltransferase domain-containing protein [Microcoleus sp. SIO2G3]|nr:methyltransferase domain-containing protein [Microcoleus sp. SIO2G3]